MSIWSRNHTELAKLAKTLHDRNVKTRNNLSRRLVTFNSTSPLDPRKCKSESCLLSTKTETKENSFTTLNGDIADDGPVDRLRVDSCSSVDSAISPDFHRNPLSPILKQSYMSCSDPGSSKSISCNGIPLSKSSDKRVTFLLQDEDNEEHESVSDVNFSLHGNGHSFSGEAVDCNGHYGAECLTNGMAEKRNVTNETTENGSATNGITENRSVTNGITENRSVTKGISENKNMTNGMAENGNVRNGMAQNSNATYNSSFLTPTSNCESKMSPSPHDHVSNHNSSAIQNDLPRHSNSDSGPHASDADMTSQVPSSSDFSSHGHEDSSTKHSFDSEKDSMINTGDGPSSPIESSDDFKADVFVSDCSIVPTDLEEDSGIYSPKPTSSSTCDDDQKFSFSTYSSDLNLSDELNLLLISLLANHRREQFAHEQDNKCVGNVAEDRGKLRTEPNSDQQNLSLGHEHNLEKSIAVSVIGVNDGNTTKSTFSSNSGTITSDVMESEVIQNPHFNEEIKNSQGQTISSEKLNTSDYGSVGDLGNVSAATDFLKDDDSSHVSASSHSQYEKVTQGSEDSKIEPTLPSIQTSVEVPATFVPNTRDTSTMLVSISSEQSPLSVVHCTGCCKNNSSGYYTTAGNANPSYIYSHLYANTRNMCDSTTSTVSQNGLEILPKSPYSPLAEKAYAHNMNKCPSSDEGHSPLSIALHTVPGNAIHPVKSFDPPITMESLGEIRERDIIPANKIETETVSHPIIDCNQDPNIINTRQTTRESDVCETSPPILGLSEESVDVKWEDNASQHDAFTQTQDDQTCDLVVETPVLSSETVALETAGIPSSNSDFIQDLADSARRKIWLNVADEGQTSMKTSETIGSSYSYLEDNSSKSEEKGTTHLADFNVNEMTDGISEHKMVNSDFVCLDKHRDFLPISQESTPTCPSSPPWYLGSSTSTKYHKVGDNVDLGCTEMAHVSLEDGDCHYSHVNEDPQYDKSLSDKPGMCLSQDDVMPMSLETSATVQIQDRNQKPSIILSPPYSPSHSQDVSPSMNVYGDISPTSKENVCVFSLSDIGSGVSTFDPTESKGTVNSDILLQPDQVNLLHLRPKSHSDDAAYKSSSGSFMKNKRCTSSPTTSDKRCHSQSTQKAETAPQIDVESSDVRSFNIVNHEVFMESTSYDSDTSSVFWSRGSRAPVKNCVGKFEKQKLSIHDQLSKISDNISWILRSQNTSSRRKSQDESTFQRKSRRKKKSHSDSCAKYPDGGRKSQLSRNITDIDSSSVLNTPSLPRSPEFSSSDSLKMEAKDLNILNFVVGNSPSDLTVRGKHSEADPKVRKFQFLFEKLNVCDSATEAHPSKDLKTVKDALCQLTVFLKQQRHCNKQKVFKEISDRSRLFRKISSSTEKFPMNKGTNERSQSLRSTSDDSEDKRSLAWRDEKRFVKQQEDRSNPDSSQSSSSKTFDEKSHQSAVKRHTKWTRKLRKVDRIFLENLLDKAMDADIDALCSGDALKDIVKEWQSVRGRGLDNNHPRELSLKLFPANTNGLVTKSDSPNAAHPLTMETHTRQISPSFQATDSSLDITASLIGQTANKEASLFKPITAEEDRKESTEEVNRPPSPTDSKPATHVRRSVATQEHRQEDHSTDKAQLSEDGEISAIMESDSQLSFRLDREFDKNLADMKPFVLKLPLKTDRQKCAVWIKKFCDPPGSGSTVRKTRNMYAQLMLQMLKKGSLSSPFDQKPEDGPLQPLPSYMSIYFDDPLTSMVGQAERLPDWVEGELGDTAGSSLFPRSLGNPAATSTWVSSVGDLRERPHSSIGHTLDKDPSLSPIRHSEFAHLKGYSVDDMSIEIKRPSPSPPQRRKSQNSPEREKRQLPDIKVREEKEDKRHQDHSHNDTDWSKPYTSTVSASLPKGTTFHEDISYHKPADREVAVRTKMIEAKFHEEKLKLQQKHDAAVQKILDRKNTEIEDVKNHYRAKSKEMEEINGKLEKKVQTLIKETDFVRESKDKQISEIKKLAEDSNETRRKEFEKKLHDVMTEFEQEKFEMQKQHTQNIQEILDDTNHRLQRMESEYSQQTTTTTNVIKELESRVQQLMNEVDSSLSQRSAVEKDRNETQAKLEKLTDEYERLKERHQQVERDHQVKTETHEHELRSLKNKTEASLEFLKQEHTMAASKASDTISEYEQKIEQLKKSLKDSEENRHRQSREMEQVHQQDKLHIENLHDKQVRNMKKEMEQLDADWSKKLAKLEQQVKDKEGEISKLREQKQQQAMQAEQALEEFKSQVEKNQARMYDEMKQQMEQVENDLSKSKQLREKQSKEFTRQHEEDKYKHQHEIAELKMSFEGEKSQIMRDVHVQKEYIITEHDKDIENLKEMHRAEVQAIEARMKERNDKADKAATDSERLIRELREELVQANQLRKQQLVELGLLREEEKQKVQRDHEAELARLRTDMEQQRLEQQKAHSSEMESVLEKTNGRLKGIEQEYAERGNKSAESIAELQSVVLQLRGDIKRSRESSDEKLAELKHQYDEERQNLRKQYAQNMMSMQKELETQHTKLRDSERQLQNEGSDHEEKVTQLKLQFEEKIRGLMPAGIKEELEDTIASLKSQVASLQQRALMLQEELDSRNRSQLGPFGSRTSSPIKSTV